MTSNLDQPHAQTKVLDNPTTMNEWTSSDSQADDVGMVELLENLYFPANFRPHVHFLQFFSIEDLDGNLFTGQFVYRHCGDEEQVASKRRTSQKGSGEKLQDISGQKR